MQLCLLVFVEVSFVFWNTLLGIKLKKNWQCPSLMAYVLCIPNTVIMGKDHFLSFMFLEIDSFISCHKIYPSINFTWFFLICSIYKNINTAYISIYSILLGFAVEDDHNHRSAIALKDVKMSGLWKHMGANRESCLKILYFLFFHFRWLLDRIFSFNFKKRWEKWKFVKKMKA